MRTLKPLLLAPALVLVLAGCGSSAKTASPSPSAVETTAAPAASMPDADASTPADADASSPVDADADSPADADAADPADATKTCDADATKADADATLPTGFPAVTGFVGISKTTAGSTTAIKGAVTGGPNDITKERDAGFAALTAAGYTPGDHDQEAGAEADGDFTGPHNGNINVRNLCKGYLVVTYTLNS